MNARRPAIAAAIAGLATAHVQGSPLQDYMLHCMGCHGTEARGVPGKVPPLANTLVLFMRSAAGRDYVLRVPGAANSALSDSELAAVLNWVAVTYNEPPNTAAIAPFTADEVSRVRHHPMAAVLATRGAVVKSLAIQGAAPPATY